VFKPGDWVEWSRYDEPFSAAEYPLMRVVGRRRRFKPSDPRPFCILCFAGDPVFFHAAIPEHWLAPASLSTFLCYRHLFDEGETSANVCQRVGAFGRHHRSRR